MSKEEEAHSYIKEAEKCLQTGLLKRSPDYDGAANEYQKAATCYKTIKKTAKSIEFNNKAAECFEKCKSYYSAAKCYEAAGMMYGKDLNQWDQAVTSFQTACAMYREHGVPDTAAQCLDRAAKIMESIIPEKAADFYVTAADVAMIESKHHQAAEFCGKAARVFLKIKNLTRAAELVQNQLEYLVEAEDVAGSSRVVVCVTLIHLARDDYVAAKRAFTDGRAYVDQQELYSMELLLDGVDTMDSKKVVNALNHPFIKSLDNEITKIVRDITNKYKALEGNDGQVSAQDGGIDSEAAALM